MRKGRDTLLTLTLLVLVFSGPAAVAAYMLAGERAAAPLIVAAAEDPTSPTAVDDSAAGTRRSTPPVLSGVLFTSGTALVDWNGHKIPVDDGSYAYLGGEEISTGPGDMGLLQLDGDSRVYVCPGSRLRLARGDDGAYDIKISQGGGRVALAPGSDYRIEANQSVLTPGPGAATQANVLEVSTFEDHPGGVVCGFASSTDVAAYPATGAGEPIALGTAGPGEIIDISRALEDEVAASGAPVVMKPIAMPAGVQQWLRDNAPYPPKPGPVGYLCRCEQLKRYADADGIPATAIVPLISPPDSLPLVALPESEAAPPVILAVPTIPDAADAGVLPEAGPVLTVPPPLVPAAGTGGGVSTTPS